MRERFLRKTIKILSVCIIFVFFTNNTYALTRAEIQTKMKENQAKIEKLEVELEETKSKFSEISQRQAEYSDVVFIGFGNIIQRQPFIVEYSSNMLGTNKTYAVIQNPKREEGLGAMAFDLMGSYTGHHIVIGYTTIAVRGMAYTAPILGDAPESYMNLVYENRKYLQRMLQIPDEKKELESENFDLEILLSDYGKEPSAWAKEEVDEAISYDIIPESFQNNYQEYITREEFCDLISHILTKFYKKSIEEILDLYHVKLPQTSPFKDTDKVEILFVNSLGIVSGTGNDLFSPKSLISREQAATLLTRFIKKMNITKTNAEPQSFLDYDNISQWAKEGVAFISACKTDEGKLIMNGSDSKFHPKDKYTREQAYITLTRAAHYIVDTIKKENKIQENSTSESEAATIQDEN